MSIPLTLLTTIDPVLREVATLGLLLDVPKLVVIQHDLLPAGDGFRRLISDRTGVLETEEVLLDHICFGCAMREDLIPAAIRVAELNRWQAMALVPPVGASSMPMARALANSLEQAQATEHILDLRSIVALVELSNLVEDVSGADLLVDRGIAIGSEDRRSIGEVLCEQVELADLVVAGSGTQVEQAFLDHLRSQDSALFAGSEPPDWSMLFEPRHFSTNLWRTKPQNREPSGMPDREGVWTLDLCSDSPLHPVRALALMQYFTDCGLRSRGRFWLPGRPQLMVEWNGVGEQLSIGGHQHPGGSGWGTRLIVTGMHPTKRRKVVSAFRSALVSDVELLQGMDYWADQDDGFDLWLGERAAQRTHSPDG